VFILDINSEQWAGSVHSEPFSFTGTGAEFFRIWIVNISLSIITLGIYSAWAKLRTKSYFYGNTHLEGNTFAYLASPIAILKGRVIALLFVLALTTASEIYPLIGVAMTLFVLAIIPWLVVRSLRFNATYTAYRNVRFNFVGGWSEAAMAFGVWPLLSLLTIGVLFPLALCRQQQFIVGNSAYGTSTFDFEVPAARFYHVCLLALGIIILGVMITAAIAQGPVAGLLLAFTYLVAFAFFRAHLFNITYAGASLNAHGFKPSMTTAGMGLLYLTNMAAMIVTLGLFYPWARIRTAQYMANSLNACLVEPLDQFVAAEAARVNALGEELGDMLDLDISL
jgi:uncharacterized membrane protein YjgN (DUF898 family)